MTDAKGIPESVTVECTFGPNEIETSKRLLRMGHITYDRTDTLRQSALCDSLLKPLDALRMHVDCYNGTRRMFSEMEGLSANTRVLRPTPALR